MPTAALVSTYTSGSPSNSFVSPTSGGLRCRCFRGGVLSISAITGSYYVKYEEGASHKWSLAASADGALRNCSYAAHHRRSSRGRECLGMVPDHSRPDHGDQCAARPLMRSDRLPRCPLQAPHLACHTSRSLPGSVAPTINLG